CSWRRASDGPGRAESAGHRRLKRYRATALALARAGAEVSPPESGEYPAKPGEGVTARGWRSCDGARGGGPGARQRRPPLDLSVGVITWPWSGARTSSVPHNHDNQEDNGGATQR